MKRLSRSDLKDQGHSEVKWTFPADGYPSTHDRPSVLRPAEAPMDVASSLVSSMNFVTHHDFCSHSLLFTCRRRSASLRR